MVKRENSAGINANGKDVKAGQFAVTTRAETPVSLIREPSKTSKAMESRLQEIERLKNYSDDVSGHYAMEFMAIDVLKSHPTAKEMIFENAEDEDDPQRHYLREVTLEDGTSVLHDLSDDAESEISYVKWTDGSTYRACGVNDGTVRINIPDALDIPEFLTDPSYVDAPQVPTELKYCEAAEAQTNVELDFVERSLKFYGGNNAERQAGEIAVRRAELHAAGAK